ncbi:MAG: site-specific tyrosine recombinase/integron integrase [archaeon]
MLQNLETELKIRGLSPKTIRNYLHGNRKFLKFIKKDPEQINQDDIKLYQAHMISELGLKPQTINLALSSLRFFYDEVLEKGLFTKKIKRPKVGRKLPTVLTKNEISKILTNITKLKPRLIIELLYSSGLRVSEATNLKITDMEPESKTAMVRSGKGDKDRMIILSSRFIEGLNQYLEERSDKSPYLFPNKEGKPVSTRYVQKVLENAVSKAGIKKRVYCHALRSSFATHLLDNDVDIRKIQVLLGHSRLDTTQIYTKVSKKQLQDIESPLDSM